ncbi:uncharacterized protein LOC110861756 [Folsomia candida]|nr:uncharacterized protein LOC110861756 [Folsomia candida]
MSEPRQAQHLTSSLIASALLALLLAAYSPPTVAANTFPLMLNNHVVRDVDDYDAASLPNNNVINYELPFLRQVRRLGSEFLGKRSSPPSLEEETAGDVWEPPSSSWPDSDGIFTSSLSKRARMRMGSEFLGKRRLGSEFLGKRKRGALGSEFLGKRSPASFLLRPSPDFSWKRARLGSEFLGKRQPSPPHSLLPTTNDF